jgi:hypothetical protein
VRLKEIDVPHQRVLRELTRRVSRQLTAEFANLPGEDGPNIGVQIREDGRTAVIQVPSKSLQHATDDASSREIVRQRIKTGRDRMLFRAVPIALEQHPPARSRPSSDSWGGGGRGRR